MAIKLSDKQQVFTHNIGKLIVWAYEQGYELTFGESYDDDGVGHMKGSTHYIRLAQDFNLFVEGQYITDSNHPAYKRLGAAWKALNPENKWGGDFTKKDGNHFSMLHEGRA